MSRDELPEPWRSALEQHGIHSKRGLASKAGISPQTAKRLIDGEGKPSPQTVAAVADKVFNGDRNRVWALAGHDRQDHGDWQLPPEASQLNQEQRAAVLAVVRAMLPQQREEAGDRGGRDAAPMNRIGGADMVIRTGPEDQPNLMVIEVKSPRPPALLFPEQIYTRFLQYRGHELADELTDELEALTEEITAADALEQINTAGEVSEEMLEHLLAAARTGAMRRTTSDRLQDQAGEESQDPGGM